MLLGDRLHHELEERVAVGGDERVGEIPVHLELAVRVLVVVLVRAPAERQHGVADLGDDVVAAHQRLLVVAGLCRGIVFVRDRLAVAGGEEELRLNAGLHAQALLGGGGDDVLQHRARRLLHDLCIHDAIGGDPGDFLLPRKLE